MTCWVGLASLLAGVLGAGGEAAPGPEDSAQGFWSSARDALTFEFHSLVFASRTETRAGGLFDPAGVLLRAPEADGAVHLRLNLRLAKDRVLLVARPRFEGTASWWRDDRIPATDTLSTDGDLFLNEWLAQVRVLPSLYLSYGREILQWGPSVFLSPSNPFFLESGRSNPELELRGKDFARLLWTAGEAWTASLILNTALALGQPTAETFEPTLAAKIDWVGRKSSASLVLTKEWHGKESVGGYFQRTATDALLVYGEGSVGLGGDGLYPEPSTNAVGWELVARERSARRPFPVALVGGAYTFASGMTVNLEYLYDGEGYGAEDARRYYALAHQLGGSLSDPADPRAPLAMATLGRGLDPHLRTLRRNYLSVQIGRTNVRDVLDWFLRYTQSLDDGSGFFAPILEWNVAQRVRLFAIGAVAMGGAESEFGRILRYQAMLGARFLVH